MAPLQYIRKTPYSFTLADGLAPFHVLGVVEVSIRFGNSTTKIHAHIARKLCATMIIGMNYINKYNLNINVAQQTISIIHNNHVSSMNMDTDFELHRIPVNISKPIQIPPRSNRSAQVSIPISSISSPFVPSPFVRNTYALSTPYTFLNFQNYYSDIKLFNMSSHRQYLNEGTCIGFLTYRKKSIIGEKPDSTTHKSFEVAGTSGLTSAPNDSCDIRVVSSKSFGVTGSTGETPVLHDLLAARVSDKALSSSDNYVFRDHTTSNSNNNSFFCNAIDPRKPVVADSLRMLVSKIENTQQQEKLYSLLKHFHKTFDTTKHSIAHTRIEHVINTVPHSPPASRPYTQPDKEEAMYKMIQEFLHAGLIQESHSPYAAPAILVKKKDDSYRFVVDYKRLNSITIKDSSPLPNMEDAIRKLGQGYSYFSKLDLKSGFYQIPINEGDKEKTAFVTPFGLYQFNVLPMGLKNSPPTFQKVMTDTLKACRLFSLVYLDDIIVFSKSFSEHLHHLEQVLLALQAKNLVLNPPKCELVAKQIDYLGHSISQDHITPMQDKIEAILQINEPRSLGQANRFIGALGWYRKFIPHFATVAAPIHAITNLTKINRRKFRWGFAQSQAFHKLKQMLITEPLFLHYPIQDKPLILATDASGIGIGGVLQQEVGGKIHNLYYHSQLMTKCERKYSAIEKEALAIYKCFERMRPVLLGRSITLITDHCPLCHIMEKTVRNARVDRITHLIQEYNIEKVVHIKGTENCLPDFLSRYSQEEDDDLFEVEYGLGSKEYKPSPTSLTTQTDRISPLMSTSKQPRTLAVMNLRSRKNLQKSVSASTSVDDDVNTDDDLDSKNSNEFSQLHETIPNFSHNYFDLNTLKDKQTEDPEIQQIIEQIKNKSHTLSFVFKDDVLYKLQTPSRNSKRKIKVIYLPSSMVLSLLKACHDDPMSGAHFGTDRTYLKIKNQYWWPHMRNSIQKYIKSCTLCQQYNISRHRKHGQLRPISPPDGPFSLVGIDYCGPLKRTPRDNQYVLVITDYFTRYTTAIALPNCTAETTAQALFNEYFCKYGVPCTILSDQGSHFQNQLMANIKRLIGYNHIYSTPYHPQTNGIVERFNSTFIPQIAKLQDAENNNWDEYLQAVVFAYNTGVHKTTKYSPFEMLYGRAPYLPINAPPTHFTFIKPNDYFEQLKKTLRIYQQAAKSNIIQQQQINKNWYDRNRLDPHYQIGNKVLTRIHGLRGKLDPKFSVTPKIIIHVNHPIYIVEDEITHVQSQVHVCDIRPILIE
ncbi:unnamed protein product [Rotaria socialis]|uniref:RNA-directed DNA polymerase n=1 Tax=Rotaria socialis TaxID=392032 RepID=A0A821TA23_9BILA|nr:unnamed protein product [Rotaria socialis]CAF4870941.1 unnamed protein product [Rotaria socialis]